jgi:hypothetical protein
MHETPLAIMAEPARSMVRAKLLDVLGGYALEADRGPFHVALLYLKTLHALALEDPTQWSLDTEAVEHFERHRYVRSTEQFPDFGVSPRTTSYVRQLLWEFYLQGILAPAPATPEVSSRTAESSLFPMAFLLHLDSVVLTAYGVEILSDTTNRIQVHDPDRYLANFLKAEPPPDPEMMRYLEEAVAVFRGGHFLATIILLGVASERLIEVLAESLRDALGDPSGVKWFNTRYANKWDISTRFNSLSGKLMDEYSEDLSRAKLKDAFDGVVTLTVEQIRCARNDIAHPKGREFTWNEVSLFLHSFVQHFIYVNQIIKLLSGNA